MVTRYTRRDFLVTSSWAAATLLPSARRAFADDARVVGAPKVLPASARVPGQRIPV